MDVEITKMSSKGQVVIPLHLREILHAKEGTVFAVTGTSDTLVLKKIEIPSKKELIKQLRINAKLAQSKLEKSGVTEEDVINAALKQKRR